MINDLLKFSRRIHFVGIGGVSMHQLAIYMHSQGYEVSGSDRQHSDIIDGLNSYGIRTQIGHNVGNILSADMVVKNAAIDDGCDEMQYAIKCDIPIIDRAEMLDYVVRQFATSIAVSGTHGKTTTSSLLYHILQSSGKNVSAHIGGDIPQRICNDDDMIVLEACEYNKSMLSMYADIVIINNIDRDHMDSYVDMSDLRDSFRQFGQNAKVCILGIDDSVQDLAMDNLYNYSWQILTDGFIVNDIYYSTFMLAEYNTKNYISAVAAAMMIGIDSNSIQLSLDTFVNSSRRAEILYGDNDIIVYSDYAHHPTEIHSFISSMRTKYDNVVVYFQPHTYSRTLDLWQSFVDVLINIDALYIVKEYAARENICQGKTAEELAAAIGARYITDENHLKECYNIEKSNAKEGTAICFIGAGDIDEWARKIIIDKKNIKNP